MIPLLARGVVKQYRDGTVANRGLDLDVYPGEIVAVLGPNGAGKTTFLRQLSTELRPTSGVIRVFGIDAVAEPQAAKRLMGITPQESGLFDSLTVRQHLELFAQLKGLEPDDAAAETDRLLGELALADTALRRVSRLSGGQQRRILIALALLGRPRLLILDEPTTGLDPAARRAVWSVLRRAVADGACVVLSTHYMEEAERLSDRVAIISGGRRVAYGSVTDLMAGLRESYRLTWAEAGGEPRVDRYDSFAAVEASIRERGLSKYSIERTSLEDVYFDLVGTPFAEEDAVAQ